jgi:hypothetical protein|tara:strand:+ start:844 stop:1080 length:237 start_codon:yes stop_codon:yes gene_type:complete
MEKVMKYFTGFLGGIVSILMAIVPVTILWTLLTGTQMFGMDIITNFMEMVNGIGSAGFSGLLALLFVMYFFLCDKCVK